VPRWLRQNRAYPAETFIYQRRSHWVVWKK